MIAKAIGKSIETIKKIFNTNNNNIIMMKKQMNLMQKMKKKILIQIYYKNHLKHLDNRYYIIKN